MRAGALNVERQNLLNSERKGTGWSACFICGYRPVRFWLGGWVDLTVILWLTRSDEILLQSDLKCLHATSWLLLLHLCVEKHLPGSGGKLLHIPLYVFLPKGDLEQLLEVYGRQLTTCCRLCL
jgi:hypothetical protein